MKKIYHLASCTTCQRIMKELNPRRDMDMQDIKTVKITPHQLDEMRKLAGSYEALFSKVALKYRSMGLNNIQLSEDDYRKLILEEYTFLKRPIILVNEQIFIGNSKQTVESAKQVI